MSSVPIEKIIKIAVERGASDLHIKAGDLFRARIDGRLVPLTKHRLTPEQTRAVALKLLPSDGDRRKIDELTDFDCSWGMPGVGRFRVNLARQRSSIMIVMRVIPFEIPTFESLGLPEGVARLIESPSGLVLVTGSSGSGKSSTIAAMIHAMNQGQQRHIVTVEDPIEFLHRDIKCSVTQREVGIDTASINQGVKAALRQDPDVIVVGGINDPETFETVIQAAETGHLVIAEMPTSGAVTTIGHLHAMLPREAREIGWVRFTEALMAIVSGQLIPRKDSDRRMPLIELLINTSVIRDILKDPGRLGDLKKEMARSQGKNGMQTFEQHLAELVKAGSLAPQTARAIEGVESGDSSKGKR